MTAESVGLDGARENHRFPIPDSRFPIPDSRFPIPDSRFPIPAKRKPATWAGSLLKALIPAYAGMRQWHKRSR
ncbi:hypothetical protein GLA29479_3275 [Lysobacter antibioticus]|nr:hypothetical protein GLA29479_3275 [Lysobacter antibioticus]